MEDRVKDSERGGGESVNILLSTAHPVWEREPLTGSFHLC